MEDTITKVDSNGSIVPAPWSRRINENRLSLSYKNRLSAATTCAFFTGVFLGLSHGSQTAGLRFRAENSHRFPITSTGWYLYHKSKNYHMMLGGVKEGLKLGSKVAFWAGGFFVIEEAVDRVRGGKRDFASTVMAGLSVAGGFSAWSRSINTSLSVKWPVVDAYRHVFPRHCRTYSQDRTLQQLGFRASPGCLELSKRSKIGICRFSARQKPWLPCYGRW